MRSPWEASARLPESVLPRCVRSAHRLPVCFTRFSMSQGGWVVLYRHPAESRCSTTLVVCDIYFLCLVIKRALARVAPHPQHPPRDGGVSALPADGRSHTGSGTDHIDGRLASTAHGIDETRARNPTEDLSGDYREDRLTNPSPRPLRLPRGHEAREQGRDARVQQPEPHRARCCAERGFRLEYTVPSHALVSEIRAAVGLFRFGKIVGPESREDFRSPSGCLPRISAGTPPAIQ